MPQNRFLDERKDAWQRLEDLLELMDSSSIRRLNREEVRELGRSYRRAASDLAIARAESRDPRLVSYLNSLVIRAHGRIYRADTKGWGRIAHFYSRDFPQVFRRRWRYTAVALAVFLIFALAGYFGTRRDPDFSEFAGISPIFRLAIESRIRWWESINEARQAESSGIMTNNIQVTFYAFALGGILGVGSLYVLAINGALFGAVFALVYRAGYGNELSSFVVGHGVIELSCIFIAGAAGLLIGSAILLPGDLSRADALKVRGKDAIFLIAGCVPVLVIAGIIEAFISPAPISSTIKFMVGIVTGLAFWSYLLVAGIQAGQPELD